MDMPKPTKPVDEMTEAEQNAFVNDLVEFFRPEAREIVQEALNGRSLYAQTTKDGYGLVLGLLSKLDPTMQYILLAAMVREGYPAETARDLAASLGA